MLHNVEVACPNCTHTRMVKNWKESWGGPPFVRLCKKCCQLNQSEETRNKKRKALKGKTKPPEYSERLKKRHQDDPSLRQNLVAGAGSGWNKGLETGPRDEETKKKISDAMKQDKESEGEK
jgi:hypothetical protein